MIYNEYKNLTAKLVKQCLKKGADAAEVYLEKSRNLNVRIRNGEVETITEVDTRGIGFRVFVKGKMGFAYSNDLSSDGLDKTIASAVSFAGHITPDKNNVLPTEKGMIEIADFFDPGLTGIPLDKKIKMTTDLETLAMKDKRITKSTGSRFYEKEAWVFIANSNGLQKDYKTTACGLGVGVVAEKGEQKTTGYETCFRRKFSLLLPLEKIAAMAAEEAYEMLDPKMVKTQKAPVLFHPNAASSILRGILGAVNGERVLQGASFLAKAMDKTVASPLFTLVDDGTSETGPNSRPFDGEGVPVQKRLIFDKGVLKGFMYNTAVAKRAGVKSSGNASRRGFQSLPRIGYHNVYMAPGDVSPEEIVKNTKKGLMVKGVTGYGINPVSGNFSGGAQGFWIENGKIAFPVKGLTIAGTADSILNGIDMVGNDLDPYRSLTAPTFRVKEMQIGGE